MESQRSGSPNELREQRESIVFAEDAAAKRARVPFWYWLGIGLLVGMEVFAVSWGTVIAISVTALAMLVIGRVLTALVGRLKGIRVGRVFGGIGSWLVLPWFVVLVALSVAGAILVNSLNSLWPAVGAALLAVVTTLMFGRGFDRLRLRLGK